MEPHQLEVVPKQETAEAINAILENSFAKAMKCFATFHAAHIRFIDSISPRGGVHFRIKKDCLRTAERAMASALDLIAQDYTTGADSALAREIAAHVLDLAVHGSDMFEGEEKLQLEMVEEIAEAVLGGGEEGKDGRPTCAKE